MNKPALAMVSILGVVSLPHAMGQANVSAPTTGPQTPGQPTTASTTLVIATRDVPPFAILNPDGTWEGISIALWKEIASKLNLDYRFEAAGLNEMLEGVEQKRFDAAVGALTMTADREKLLDFTHPFFRSGLGIAVPRQVSAGWTSALSRLLSMRFLQAVIALALLLFIVGLLVWIFERRRNPEQFGGSPITGIGSSFWWSAVTMTTVGYGDKAPQTVPGRLVALVWMFASIIVISGFTAAIASALTVSELSTGIQGPEDLPGVRVGTVDGSTSAVYLQQNRISRRTYGSLTDALQGLEERKVDAVVYDAPILKYFVNLRPDSDLHVLPRDFDPQAYAIALPQDSPLREPANRIILETIGQPQWRDMIYRYLGK